MSEKIEGEMGSSVDYGVCYLYHEKFEEDPLLILKSVDEAELIKWLHADAADQLPPGTHYEIRKMVPLHYGRGKGMAWYHLPSMGSPDDGDASPGSKDGYFLVGRYATPAKETKVA